MDQMNGPMNQRVGSVNNRRTALFAGHHRVAQLSHGVVSLGVRKGELPSLRLEVGSDETTHSSYINRSSRLHLIFFFFMTSHGLRGVPVPREASKEKVGLIRIRNGAGCLPLCLLYKYPSKSTLKRRRN